MVQARKAKYGINGMTIIEDSDERFYAIFRPGLPFDGRYKIGLKRAFLMFIVVFAGTFAAMMAYGPEHPAILAPPPVLAGLAAFLSVLATRRGQKKPFIEMTPKYLKTRVVHVPFGKAKLGKTKAVKAYTDKYNMADMGAFYVTKYLGMGCVFIDYGNDSHEYRQQFPFHQAMMMKDILNDRRRKMLGLDDTKQSSMTRTELRSATF